MLLGGAVGFIQTMDRLNVKPDMKTFTLLLDIIPSTEEAENVWLVIKFLSLNQFFSFLGSN